MVSSLSAARLAPIATRAPSAANAIAVARPIPELPPVMTATLPSNSLLISGRITTSHALEQALHSHATAHATGRPPAPGARRLYPSTLARNLHSPVPGAAVVTQNHHHRARRDGFHRCAGVSSACGEGPAGGDDGLHRTRAATKLQTASADLVHDGGCLLFRHRRSRPGRFL